MPGKTLISRLLEKARHKSEAEEHIRRGVLDDRAKNTLLVLEREPCTANALDPLTLLAAAKLGPRSRSGRVRMQAVTRVKLGFA